MRTAGLVVALGGLLNVAFANVVCNTEAVHSKPRIISTAEKDGFATSIEEACSTTDTFSESRSGSTVFTVAGTDENLGSDDCEAQFHAIIEQCVAGHNFGGGRLTTTDGLTFDVSTTDAEGGHALEARKSRGGRSRSSRTRTKKTRPKKTKTKKTKTKTKKPKTKKPAKTPTSCPLPKKKTGIKRFIPDFLLKRSGSSSGGAGAGCSTPEDVNESNAFKSVAKTFPNAKDGEFYKFTSRSPFTEPGPNETEDELKQLQRKLDFNHIAVIVGEVKITEKIIGKGAKAKKKVTKDFAASIIDLWKMENGDSKYNEKVFAPKKVFKLDQGAKTTKAKAGKAKAKGKEYFDEPGHKKYSVASNNCNTFAQELLNDI